MKHLPKIGEKYSPEEIIDMCLFFEWHELAHRIEAKREILNQFVTDGCSWWPDEWKGVNYTACCVRHDIAYWVGGTLDQKFIADCELAICICKMVGWRMALTMFLGVQASLFPGSVFKMPWRWGYGERSQKKIK